MIKQIRQYAKVLNLTRDKNGILAYGTYNGRFISIWETQYIPPSNPGVVLARMAHQVKITAKTQDPMARGTIQGYLQRQPGHIAFLQEVSYDGKMITALFVMPGGGKAEEYASSLDGFVRDVTDLCASSAVTAGCEICGAADDAALYITNALPRVLCPNCLKQVKMQAEQKKRQGNVMQGLLGAILCALIGVVIWVGIYQMGYISIIGAMALTHFVFQGYKLMGGYMTKTGIAISCIVSILMMLFAEQIYIAILIRQAYQADLNRTFLEIFFTVPSYLAQLGNLKAVLLDVLFGVIYVAGCVITTGIRIRKQHAGAINIRRVTCISG
ncbi:MAG: hypothetical protein IJ747_08865 [Lachnospiraceae bacterium]|nr:hypothetical protein [Lachnospiraceae bacterium]